jgi:release factor glutamine methyltransferase
LFYDYIADFALSHLLDTGSLYFEINQYLGLETADMLRKKGFVDVRLLKDINAVDRMIVAKKK